ncbi:MAG TPA: peptidoglycan DD-metalloendopeptidase family protein [Croceibacterium sp.]|nr:peptidoglycan DD-metalloendopeptidase family protein [Croceibacterium sp.]
MRKPLALILAAASLSLAWLSASAVALRSEGPAETRAALRRALAESEAAETRSARLEREAAATRDAAERTARQAAALAARIQQAEAGSAAAEARLSLATRELAALRESLGREQQPVIHLTGALQQFSRRPVALAVLRPGSVEDLVHLRAMLDSAVPQIQARTAGLRARLSRSRALRAAALAAAGQLRAEQTRLAERRRELAALESRQRLASRAAGGAAAREAERALALAEQARDLDSLVAELDRAGTLRARLAALPGPVMRPARPEEPGLAALPEPAVPEPSATAPPAPYLLPVAGRTVAGFGTGEGATESRGLTLAPRPGAQVVAPAAGRVAFAGPYRGYGRIVIIEHPGGWTSLVTGLARTDVAVGEELVAGGPLGIAAQASPEVTLELRREGEPVNPLRFVG